MQQQRDTSLVSTNRAGTAAAVARFTMMAKLAAIILTTVVSWASLATSLAVRDTASPGQAAIVNETQVLVKFSPAMHMYH